jgi:Tfp pilus assembly protein PilO
MSRLRGKEIYLIAALVAVVLIVAWYFLLFSPTRADIAALDDQIATEQAALSQAQQEVARLEQYKKTAPQSRADIVRLSKALPGSEGVPSLLVELGNTAGSSGVNLVSITRGTTQEGTPFGIQAVNLTVEGQFFDLEDFFYRLENYVDFQNEKFVANGRLLQLANISVTGGAATTAATTAGSPTLQATITMNAFLQPATASTATTATSGSATTTTSAGGGQ